MFKSVVFAIFIICVLLICWGLFRADTPPEYLMIGSIKIPTPDKWIHFLSFIILTVSFMLVHSNRFLWTKLSILIFFAVSSEFLQGFLQASRNHSNEDIIANVSGVVIGFIISRWFLKTLNKKE